MVTLLPLPLPPSAPGASQHGFRSGFFVVCFEKRSHFHFQGAPNVFSCSGPSRRPQPPSPSGPGSCRPTSSLSREPVATPGGEGGPGARRPLRRPPSRWRPKGLQEPGWGSQRGRITNGSVPGGEGTKKGSHGPVGARRAGDGWGGAVAPGSFLRFLPRSPRCERGKPWGSRDPGRPPSSRSAGGAERGAHFELALRPLVTRRPGWAAGGLKETVCEKGGWRRAKEKTPSACFKFLNMQIPI